MLPFAWLLLLPIIYSTKKMIFLVQTDISLWGVEGIGGGGGGTWPLHTDNQEPPHSRFLERPN